MKVYHSTREIPGNTGSIVAVGLFDGLHIGHRAVIEHALLLAHNKNLDAIVLTFEITEQSHPDAKRTDNRLLTSSLFEKILCDMGISAVVRLSFESIHMLTDRAFAQNILVSCLGAQAVCCGENFHFGRGAAGNVEALRRFGHELGFSAEILPLANYGGETISATRIRACLKNGDLESTAAMLGRPYSINFETASVNSAGFATGIHIIKQVFPCEYITPPAGAYASAVNISGRRIPVVSNIFPSADNTMLCETYANNLLGMLCETSLNIELLSYLHPPYLTDGLSPAEALINEDFIKSATVVNLYPIQ